MMEKAGSSRDIRIVSIGAYGRLGFVEQALQVADGTTSDLCIKALENLVLATPSASAEVQLLCVVSRYPDCKNPHIAAMVHQRLELRARCMTFDLYQGCLGYVQGVAVVHALMARLRLDRALLFTSDPYTKIVDVTDRDPTLRFMDAATATLLLRTDGPGYSLVDAEFGTAPKGYSVRKHHREMVTSRLPLNPARWIRQSVQSLLARNRLSADDIDLFLFHPGSRNLVHTLRRNLGISESKLSFDGGSYADTVSSSIPLMLKKPLATRAYPWIIFSGFADGFSWGSCLIEAHGGGRQVAGSVADGRPRASEVGAEQPSFGASSAEP